MPVPAQETLLLCVRRIVGVSLTLRVVHGAATLLA